MQLVEAINKEEEVRKCVLNGKILSAVVDSGATSNCGMEGDPYEETDQISNKIFHMPMGKQAPASNISKYHHNLREPERTVDMVPGLVHNS